ncbi:ParB/RepB/Spo0J family partition protein [Treponema berlinense]|uniref:ParB/RepB/Spo0J family partition protein n=1 Tax=Treponema berlinense TaxID=225004 RepID=UPI0023567BCB|nr:ParB/RepB/Spo0J family partition protein [Treponema berlinense]MCI5540473.1 ParB/RepB/Spo0J family partition protein [Treponema berlinense]MDY3707316.1 ParB/RepB/Spo0J family partition protein [Treponema berlinense]
MAKKFGLGNGLDSLLGSSAKEDEPAKTENSFQSVKTNLPAGIEQDEFGKLWINPELLRPNPYQPRQEFDPEQLKELSDSIKENGVIQPVTIEDAKDGTFYIIAGERRTRASRLAGLEKIPVQLSAFSDQKKLEVALIENIQRADLNPVEEARAYYKLMELGGLKQEEVAQKVGKNRATVANAIRLLKLPEDIQNALVGGQITAGHARALLMVKDKMNMHILFGKIVGQGLSVHQTEVMASEINNPQPKIKKNDGAKSLTRDPDLIDVETQLIQKLGTKVQIKGSYEKGSIEISYFSKDDFNRLFDFINR